MPGANFYEKESGGTLRKLSLYEHIGDGVLRPLYLSEVGEPPDPTIPPAPGLTGSMVSQTESTIMWTPQTQSGIPPIIGWNVDRRFSTDNGTTWSVWAPIIGSPFSAVTRTAGEIGLSTGTPEYIFQYRVGGENADGFGFDSAILALQWEGNQISQPSAPYALGSSNLQPTSINLFWEETLDPTVDKHTLYQGTSPGTILRDNLDATIKSYILSGLTANTVYSGLNIRRTNEAGQSPSSNVLPAFTTPTQPSGTQLFSFHQPGKIYYGFSRADGTKNSDCLGAGNPASIGATNNIDLGGFPQGQSMIGAPANTRVSFQRIYDKDDSQMATRYGQDIFWWLSGKTGNPGFGLSGTWGTIAAGGTTVDNAIRNYFANLVALDRPMIWTFAHEPENDVAATGNTIANWCEAWRHIMDVFEAEYGTNTYIAFGPNMQGFRWNQNVSAGHDMRQWFPNDLVTRWDLVTYNMYMNTGSATSSYLSQRAPKIENFFRGTYTQPGASGPLSTSYNPGVNLAFGIGEHASRWKYADLGTAAMSAAQWARDAEDYLFARPNIYPVVSWFNSIGVEDERLEVPTNAGFGDTQRVMDVYREKANSTISCKITDIGL